MAEQPKSRRILAVDAARGSAMVLVCLSHIKQHFEVSAPALYSFLTATTRIATPTFLLLSGFVIGHLLRSSSGNRVEISLVDRGLFLLLVAHVLLGLADLPEAGVFEWLFGKVMITDVIGVALFVAVVARRTSAAALMAAGVALFTLSWLIAMTLSVQSPPLQLLSSLLFHSRSESSTLIDVALLPYLGLFLIGMALSSQSRAALLAGDDRRLARRLFTIGISAVTVVIVGVFAWHFGKDSLPEALRPAHVAELLRGTLNPANKWPPSPAYMLFYGGAGLLMTAMFFHGRPGRLVRPMANAASVIGRASLMCFVVQDWLFFLAPAALGFREVTSVAFWLTYFAASVLLLYWLARMWNSASGNRYLTVGLKWIARHRDVRTPESAVPTPGRRA